MEDERQIERDLIDHYAKDNPWLKPRECDHAHILRTGMLWCRDCGAINIHGGWTLPNCHSMTLADAMNK